MTDYAQLLSNQNVKAFLALIKYTEGAGYQTLFGGERFTSFDDHPRRAITKTLGGKPITSTAAGAYQFLSRTWDECASAIGLTDFSPLSQDKAALFLIERRRALNAVLAGDWTTALERCNREWARLPGSPYGQPTKTLDTCLSFLYANTKKEEATAPAPFSQPKPEKPSWFHSLLQLFRR
jgi:lysozyme